MDLFIVMSENDVKLQHIVVAKIGIKLNKGVNCKTKTRPCILWPENARSNCKRQLHRIVLVECTWLAIYCYSYHYHVFSAGNRYFCMNLFIDHVIVDLIVLKLGASCGNLVQRLVRLQLWGK